MAEESNDVFAFKSTQQYEEIPTDIKLPLNKSTIEGANLNNENETFADNSTIMDLQQILGNTDLDKTEDSSKLDLSHLFNSYEADESNYNIKNNNSLDKSNVVDLTDESNFADEADESNYNIKNNNSLDKSNVIDLTDESNFADLSNILDVYNEGHSIMDESIELISSDDSISCSDVSTEKFNSFATNNAEVIAILDITDNEEVSIIEIKDSPISSKQSDDIIEIIDCDPNTSKQSILLEELEDYSEVIKELKLDTSINENFIKMFKTLTDEDFDTHADKIEETDVNLEFEDVDLVPKSPKKDFEDISKVSQRKEDLEIGNICIDEILKRLNSESDLSDLPKPYEKIRLEEISKVFKADEVINFQKKLNHEHVKKFNGNRKINPNLFLRKPLHNCTGLPNCETCLDEIKNMCDYTKYEHLYDEIPTPNWGLKQFLAENTLEPLSGRISVNDEIKMLFFLNLIEEAEDNGLEMYLPSKNKIKHLYTSPNAKKFLNLAKKFKHSQARLLVKEKAKKVELSSLDFVSFTEMLYELFQNGGVTTERIMVLFFFCADLSIHAMRHRLRNLMFKIYQWVVAFLSEFLARLVIKMGGLAIVLGQTNEQNSLMRYTNGIYAKGFFGFGIFAIAVLIYRKLSNVNI